MLSILHADDDVVVLDKPAGLAFQPGEGVGRSLVELAEEELGFKPYPVHRLDRDTSGCVVLARSRSAAARYAVFFSDRNSGARKVYGAIVAGRMGAPRGLVDTPIGVRGEAKAALSRWTLVEAFADFSLLDVELGSGRTHQIRIHLASIAHPLVGDDRHGDFALNKAALKAWAARRLMLWARALELPVSPPLRVEAPPPPHVLDFLARLRAAARAADPL